jgi:hypothetical protein
MSIRGSVFALLFAVGLLSAAAAPDVEPLFQAIRKADTAAVKRVLERGMSPDAQDAEGTPG